MSAGTPPDPDTLHREAGAGDSASVKRELPEPKRELPEPVVKVRKKLGSAKRALQRGVKAAQNPPRPGQDDGAGDDDAPAIPVPVGNHVPAGTKLPVALIVMWDVPDERVTAVVDDVARLQVATMAFKPMFVTRSDDYAAFRRHGYLFEYLMPTSDWVKVRPIEEWRDYAEARLASIIETYRPVHVVTLSGALDGDDDVLGCLLPLVARR
jgi:hypothetical protein